MALAFLRVALALTGSYVAAAAIQITIDCRVGWLWVVEDDLFDFCPPGEGKWAGGLCAKVRH